MNEKTNPFTETSDLASKLSNDCQERNRLWWEAKPMTYADWDMEDRNPKTLEEFLEIEKYMFTNSPFIREEYEFESKAGKMILDIGSGAGGFSCCFAKAGALVSSIDITDIGVHLTALNAKLRKLDVVVVQADAERLPLHQDTFDYVFSWGVLHHTNDINAALLEVKRVLKPGGQGIIMVYHKNSIVYYIHGAYWLIFRGKLLSGYKFSTVQKFYTDGFYHQYLSRNELVEMLIDSGLSPIRAFCTQYEKKILPLIPNWLDRWLKLRFGMCVVVEFENEYPQ